MSDCPERRSALSSLVLVLTSQRYQKPGLQDRGVLMRSLEAMVTGFFGQESQRKPNESRELVLPSGETWQVNLLTFPLLTVIE